MGGSVLSIISILMRILDHWKIPLLIGIIVWIIWSVLRPYCFHEALISPLSDTWDYAQQGREIYLGHGFSSLFNYPVLWERFHSLAATPNFWRPPLYPLLIALGYQLMGTVNLNPLIFLGGLFLALTAALIVRLLEEATASPYSWAGGLIYGFTPAVLQSSFSGLSEPVYAFWMTAVFYNLYRLIKTNYESKGDLVITGIFFGLAWLTRAETLFFLPVLLVFFYLTSLQNIRIKIILYFLVPVLILMSPWWIRNYLLTGNPFFNMSNLLISTYTPTYPGWIRYRMIESSPGLIGFIFTHLPELTVKFIRNIIHNGIFIFSLHVLMVPLFNIGVLADEIRKPLKIAGLAGILLVLLLLAVSPLSADARFFLGIFPMVIVIGLTAFIMGIDRLSPEFKISKELWIGLLVVGMAFPVASILWTKKTLNNQLLNQWESSQWGSYQEVLWNTGKGIIISDIPDQLSWKTGIRTLWLPVLKDLPKLSGDTTIKGILLTAAINRYHGDPDWNQWREIFKDAGTIPGFRLNRVLENGSLYYQRGEMNPPSPIKTDGKIPEGTRKR